MNVGTVELFVRAVELEGLIVTGMAIAAPRREVGNSVALITSETIEAAGAVSIDDILRGGGVGLSIQGSSGVAGAGSQMMLRGLSSLNGRTRPLIGIDSVRMNDRGACESGGSTGGQAATVPNSMRSDAKDPDIEIIVDARFDLIEGS